MLDARFVVDNFTDSVKIDGKWTLVNIYGKRMSFDVPEDYWFPNQVEHMNKSRYLGLDVFYRTWAIMVLNNTGLMVSAKAEKDYCNSLDRKPRGKDFQKAENAGDAAEQEFLKKVLAGT